MAVYPKALTLATLLFAGACQEAAEPGESSGSTTPRYERAEADASPLAEASRPVRIGESGPGFAACTARATTRARSGEEALTVRAAPYAAAQETGRLPAKATFFVCSRSHDQKWFGIVYDGSGAAPERCGVSRPVPSGRDYEGPCGSGWVASASVKLIAG